MDCELSYQHNVLYQKLLAINYELTEFKTLRQRLLLIIWEHWKLIVLYGNRWNRWTACDFKIENKNYIWNLSRKNSITNLQKKI